MELEIVLIEKFLISIALGTIIGTERQISQTQPGEKEAAGLRTFALITLLGTLLAHLSQLYPYLILVGAGAFISLVVACYWRASSEHMGMTTEVGLIIAFLLGVLCYMETNLAVMLTIVVTVILAVKKSVHSLIEKISEEELLDSLKFGLIALVVLPLLPNRTIDPLNVLNLYKIWLLVVFISGIGFVGYILMKVFGAQSGTGLTGIMGGVVSSTAVTVAMSHRSRESPAILFPALFATTIAHAIMFPRILLEVFVVNRELLYQQLFPMGAMMVTGVAVSVYFWSKRIPSKIDVDVKDPFNLTPALKFGVFFAFVLVVSKVAAIYLGDLGIYATSLLSGLADVDAITLSMASLAGTEVSHDLAVDAITLAAISNVIAKTGMAAFFGSRKFRKYMILTSAAVMVVGFVIIVT
jgi:uncharacterized membrane protein (DUF4010 family)